MQRWQLPVFSGLGVMNLLDPRALSFDGLDKLPTYDKVNVSYSRATKMTA